MVQGRKIWPRRGFVWKLSFWKSLKLFILDQRNSSYGCWKMFNYNTPSFNQWFSVSLLVSNNSLNKTDTSKISQYFTCWSNSAQKMGSGRSMTSTRRNNRTSSMNLTCRHERMRSLTLLTLEEMRYLKEHIITISQECAHTGQWWWLVLTTSRQKLGL